MKKLLNKYIPFFTLLFFITLPGCVNEAPVGSDYYADNSRIAGGAAPGSPVLSYNSSELEFTWSASIDPDTGDEAGIYYLYYYFNEIPADPYHVDYLIAVINTDDGRKATLSSEITRSGSHYFAVTGYDGGRESEISNIITVTVN